MKNPEPQFPADPKISPQLHDLVRRLLEVDPEKRLSWSEFLTHPALNINVEAAGIDVSRTFAFVNANVPAFVDSIELNIRNKRPSSEDNHEKISQVNVGIDKDHTGDDEHRDLTVRDDKIGGINNPGGGISNNDGDPEQEESGPADEDSPGLLPMELEVTQFQQVLRYSELLNRSPAPVPLANSTLSDKHHMFRQSKSILPKVCYFCWRIIPFSRMKCSRCFWSAHLECVQKNTNSTCPIGTKIVNGHGFVWTTFSFPHWCVVCHGFLWGFSVQGLMCNRCNVVVHNQCANHVLQCRLNHQVTPTGIIGVPRDITRKNYGNSADLLEKLTKELLLCVMKRLDAKSLWHLAQVNRRCLCAYWAIITANEQNS